MGRKWVVAALACVALLVPAVLAAVATKTGDGAAAPPTRLGSNEEFSYLGQGSDESGEAGSSAAQEDYANRAYPSDTTDATGNTIYVGTGEENGSSDNEAGLGVYKSTDGGNHWSVLPGSVAAAKDRGVGDIAIDPTNPSHIYIGTMVARHGVSSSNGGRFTPPGAPRLGLYESKDGGNTF